MIIVNSFQSSILDVAAVLDLPLILCNTDTHFINEIKDSKLGLFCYTFYYTLKTALFSKKWWSLYKTSKKHYQQSTPILVFLYFGIKC